VLIAVDSTMHDRVIRIMLAHVRVPAAVARPQADPQVIDVTIAHKLFYQ
jgi:hypothetical protein